MNIPVTPPALATPSTARRVFRPRYREAGSLTVTELAVQIADVGERSRTHKIGG